MSVTCSVAGCDRPLCAREMCSGHYGRWRKTGDPGPATFRTRGALGTGEQRPSAGPCSVPPCNEPARTRGWCKAHYQRWLDYGDPGSSPIVKKTAGKTCTVAGCSSPHTAKGLCRRHYHRRNATARPMDAEFIVHPIPREELTYHTLHLRLYAKRGPASEFSCIACGQEARHWAYQHNDPNVMVDAQTGLLFSDDIFGSYAPMCVSCHFALDRSRSGAKVS